MFNLLIRNHLSLLVAFSGLAGYLFHPSPPAAADGLLLVVGIWCLTAGASALNQAQERSVDARMARTCMRPLATGRLSLSAGLGIGILLLLGGFFALSLIASFSVFLLGLIAVLWYNGIYTPLKRLTPFAVLPGALCGAIPPIMGWVLAGGAIFDYPIMLLSGVIFLWQVPHFWLLALAYPEDARRSGLPDIFTRIRPERLRQLCIVWIAGLLAGVALVNLSGLIRADLGRVGVAVAMLLLAGAVFRYRNSDLVPAASSRLFVRLNLFMTMWLAVVALDNFAVQSILPFLNAFSG